MSKNTHAYTIHALHLTSGDAVRVTGNIVVYSIFYTIAGAFLSYILYYLFDEFNETWETRGLGYQLFDVSAEVSIIGVVAFWLVYFINVSAPIIPVKKGLEDFVDSYTAGLFFMFAIFIFLGDLSKKLTYIFDTFVGSHFDRVFPAEGSMLDGTLRYSNKQKAGK
jgi:SNF family Na+-dependent transporter